MVAEKVMQGPRHKVQELRAFRYDDLDDMAGILRILHCHNDDQRYQQQRDNELSHRTHPRFAPHDPRDRRGGQREYPLNRPFPPTFHMYAISLRGAQGRTSALLPANGLFQPAPGQPAAKRRVDLRAGPDGIRHGGSAERGEHELLEVEPVWALRGISRRGRPRPVRARGPAPHA